jgi:hypothetical protein
MENSRSIWLIISVYVLILLASCETGKDDRVEVDFIYNLTQLHETDSTVTLKFNFSTTKSQPTNIGEIHLLNMDEALVSIIPIVDSNANFISTVVAGNALTQIQAVVNGSTPRIDNRGVYLEADESTNNLILEYQFTLRKKVPYLFYHTFGMKTCEIAETSPVSERTIEIREFIEPKNSTAEFAQIERLMNTDFPVTPTREMRGYCAQSETSFAFYRDRPVKLLYYP